MHTALETADWLLFWNREKFALEDADLMTCQKLQKLLYYVQGCHLALYGTPMFEEKLIRAKNGPVIEEILEKYKMFHGRDIDEDLEDLSEAEDRFTPEERLFLEMVCDEFGGYSSWGLRNKILRERPFEQTPMNEEIPLDDLKTYFEETYLEED